MNKKSKSVFYSFLTLVGLLCVETLYLEATKSISSDMLNSKMTFVNLVGLPDLAISTEATYVRHRSMSDLFSIYKDDGTLREYFPSTYAYSHSHIINQKSLYEK
jgi:hypothetical protein